MCERGCEWTTGLGQSSKGPVDHFEEHDLPRRVSVEGERGGPVGVLEAVLRGQGRV